MAPKTKTGARHSEADRRSIQDVHDYAVALGASCPGQPADVVLELADEPVVTHFQTAETLKHGAAQILSKRSALAGDLRLSLADPLSGSDADRWRRR